MAGSNIRDRIVTAEEAAKAVPSGARVRFPIGQNPLLICDQLAARLGVDLDEIEMVHTATGGNFPWTERGFEDSTSVVHEHWAAPVCWEAMKARRHDYLPMPFSLRFKAANDDRSAEEQRNVDVVCVQVSPPDEHGMVNVGRAIWDTPEYMRRADLVLAEIQPDMPIFCGDGSVPADLVTHFVESGTPLARFEMGPEPDFAETLARNVATLIEDGDTLQIGSGNATYQSSGTLARILREERNDLGWHSEATPPAIVGLVEAGVITSKTIPSHPGVSVSANWLALSDDLAFAERNPAIMGREIWKVVDPRAVAEIPHFKAINTVIMMDLSGQGAAESIGTAMHGGTGGLLELTMGALWSPGGRSILVLPSTDASGTRSRIVPLLPEGTQTTIPRTLVDTVVTEYGIARLLGRTARERADALVAVAAPQFRDELEDAAHRLFHP
jgi:4-hydroxybutyrate CoA-transferase